MPLIELRSMERLHLGAKSLSQIGDQNRALSNHPVRQLVPKNRDPNGIRIRFSDFAELRESGHNAVVNCALTAIDQ